MIVHDEFTRGEVAGFVLALLLVFVVVFVTIMVVLYLDYRKGDGIGVPRRGDLPEPPVDQWTEELNRHERSEG